MEKNINKEINNMKIFWSIILVVFSLLFVGCSDDEKIPADADDNFITALALTKDGEIFDAVIEGNDIIISVPYTIDLDGAIARMTYTPSAKILPNPESVTDWDSEMVFRVTSFNGSVNEYTYKIIKTEIESQGDVVLKSQAEVDAFADTKVSVIKGNLIIGDNSDNAEAITNLTSLSGVKEISGTLQILDSYKGEALDGLNFTKVGGLQFGTKDAESKCVTIYRFRLESLQEIEGDFQLNNSTVQFIELDNLVKINGSIYIKGDAVTTFSFPKLSQIEGDFDLSENSKMPLTNFEMSLLESVSGRFSMIPSDNLKSVSLPELRNAGSISFIVGWGLKTLKMPALLEVNGDLHISSRYESTPFSHTCNSELGKIEGLDKLKQVKGTFTLSCFDGLVEFPNLSSLTLLGAIYLERMDYLYNKGAICDLSNVEFQSFNNVQPFIQLDGSWFNELKTKEDLSNVNIDMSINLYDDTTVPKVYFKKAASFNCTFNMAKVKTKNQAIPLEEVSGDVNLEYKNGTKKTIDCTNLKSVEGSFMFTSWLANSIDLSNLDRVGKWFYLNALGARGDLKLGKLQSVNMNNSSSVKSRAVSTEDRKKGLFIGGFSSAISLPELETVGGICGFMSFSSLSCAKLKSVSEKLILSTTSNCTQVSFPELNSVPNIMIENMRQLSDFSTFATVINNGSITEENWSVTGCAYNPTYQDMKEGRYKPAE